jgi:hypothetical protein
LRVNSISTNAKIAGTTSGVRRLISAFLALAATPERVETSLDPAGKSACATNGLTAGSIIPALAATPEMVETSLGAPRRLRSQFLTGLRPTTNDENSVIEPGLGSNYLPGFSGEKSE